MGIFSSISDAIFGSDEEGQAEAATAEAAPAEAAKPARAAITEEELKARIAAIPGADDLNWEISISDLLRVVQVDPSYENRKQLAVEMGNTDYSGSAEDNIALHQAVMTQMAQAGGIVPDHLKA